tara:strand:+ start:482 stop:916 length:435 start_codon:yes stop_codon:yes gene_type:complete
MEKVKSFLGRFGSSAECDANERDKIIIDYWNSATDKAKKKKLKDKMVKCIRNFSKNPRNSRFGAYDDKRLLELAQAVFDDFSPLNLDKKIHKLLWIENPRNDMRRRRTEAEDKRLKKLKLMREKMPEEKLSQMNSWNVEEKLKF